MRVDCHIHMVLDGEYWKAAIADHAKGVNDALCHSRLAQYRQLGYTYLRDGGDRWGVGARARQLAPAYGITYRTPLAPLCLEGHYGKFIGLTYEDPAQFARLVVQQRHSGADFVKIMISGLMDFDRFGVLTEPGMDKDTIRQLIRIAHEEGMSVMAHANGTETVLPAAEAGVDSVEHGAYLHEEALFAMKEAGTVWVPTLSTIGNLRGTGRFCEKAVASILESAQENVHHFHSIGGLLAPGTDAGAWNVPHGSETELPLLMEAGVSEAALQTGIRTIANRF